MTFFKLDREMMPSLITTMWSLLRAGHGLQLRLIAASSWKDFLIRISDGHFRVKPDFQKVTRERYLELSTQKRTIFSSYERQRFENVVSYEFLLPLTREGELRRALDELFYLDTLSQRLQEIGVERLASWFRREAGDSSEEYIAKVAHQIGERFGGYSISHVSGRFRKVSLTTRAGAARLLEQNYDYLIDETTASVRFVIPVFSSAGQYQVTFGRIDSQRVGPSLLELEEVNLIHEVFFELFAEPAVKNVSGEDQIWLIEDSPADHYLYVWKRPS